MKQSYYFLFIFFLVCFTSKLYSQSVPSYVPTNGLVGWWGFNGNAQDGSGNGNHGTVNGATLTTDRFGNQNGAYSFDGVDDYINVSDHPDLRLTNTDFTIAIWCKIHQYGLPNRIYISKTDGPGNTSKWILWNIAVINGGPSVGFHSNGSQGSFLLSYGSPQISEWHQVVVRKTGSILEIFNDAVFQVYSNTFQMQPSLSDIRIGGDEVNGGGHWHNGKLDDIGIWNRALTQQEITNLYNSQLPTQTSLCLPTITTNTPTSIGIDSVVVGGDILNDGGSSIVLRGICYSSTPNSNMGNPRTEEGSGIGSFTTTLRNLSPSTTYYARSYAKNSQGVVVYGNEVIFTTGSVAPSFACGTSSVSDVDGNNYNTVQIGNQCWTQSNLKVSKYRNGDSIPTGLSNTAWQNTTAGAYAIYDNNPVNDGLYGKLYNHYAVMDTRGLCPTGWHVPTDGEWTTLETFLGGTSVAGGALKSTATQPTPGGWLSPNTGATNSSGFSAGPGGLRIDGGAFYGVGYVGYWWSSSLSGANAWYRLLNYGYGNILRDNDYRPYGFSVRCLRD
jgi:uncharacterized protein (TIGR02145 family)